MSVESPPALVTGRSFPRRIGTPATRRTLLGGAFAGLLGAGLGGCSGKSASTSAPPPASVAASTGTASTSAAGSPTPAPASAAIAAELLRGGTTIFPHYRLVGYCGYPGATALGPLGTGNLDRRAEEIERRGRAYAAGREVLPVLELIATMVQASPGADGKWRGRAPAEVVDRFLKVARKHKALLLLNIQPGHSDFLTEVKHFERWLKQPDVGVALDPEWAMQPGQRPGNVYGSTTGKELNSVAAYLSKLVQTHHLPEKAMVYHQVAASVVKKESQLHSHPGVALIKSVDGIGSREMKLDTYKVLTKHLAKNVHPGFKLFFEEDERGAWKLMTPKQVLALHPRPEYVMYE